ncbi:hypothetical protein B0H15DRAFT_244411 [Mycena belliarum]|uniref:MYND-type domain-containing protein n=1 Tax=Mycena belliarum TaxID=1033014 RepID=A0AAD6XPZ1_9AGAR|nr:hypothetical protein B0H15DRAFT_244411 [Mycena belliae]
MAGIDGIKLGGIEIEHAVHPDIKKYHKSFATPVKEMRQRRNQNTFACATCFKLEGPAVKLRNCARCNHVQYCSKECQKKDWALHKTGCSPSASNSPSILKIAQIIFASTFLDMHLQNCVVMAFDLVHRPVGLEKPIVARLDIATEPTELMRFFDIYLGRPVENVQGMVQLNAFTPLPDFVCDKGPMGAWQKMRDDLVSAGPAAAGLVASVALLIVSKANALVCIAPLMITHEAVGLVRRAPKVSCASAITGTVHEEEYTVHTALEMMNKHIRADDGDRLSLRMPMAPSDIQTIRDARTASTARPADWPAAPPRNLAASLLKEKMGRDKMYTPTIQYA